MATEAEMAADTATRNDVALTSLNFVIYLRGTPRQVRAVLTDPAPLPLTSRRYTPGCLVP